MQVRSYRHPVKRWYVNTSSLSIRSLLSVENGFGTFGYGKLFMQKTAVIEAECCGSLKHSGAFVLVGDTSDIRRLPCIHAGLPGWVPARGLQSFCFLRCVCNASRIVRWPWFGSGGTCARKRNFAPSETQKYCCYSRVVLMLYLSLSVPASA